MDKSNESYVTPELMSELDEILAEEQVLFDDFSAELADFAPGSSSETISQSDSV